jgi:hypothetical protein
MIVSMETANRLWLAHREIEVGQKLLADIRETVARGEPTPLDRGYPRGYQLGVPSGSGHRVLDVAPELAERIVEAHIANKREELRAASLNALRELEAGDE